MLISGWLTRRDEHLGDLHGVERRALAELIAADEEVEAQPLGLRQVPTDSASDDNGCLSDRLIDSAFAGVGFGAMRDSEETSCDRSDCLQLIPGLRVSERLVVRGGVQLHRPFGEGLSLFETFAGVGYRF